MENDIDKRMKKRWELGGVSPRMQSGIGGFVAERRKAFQCQGDSVSNVNNFGKI